MVVGRVEGSVCVVVGEWFLKQMDLTGSEAIIILHVNRGL